MRVHSIPASNKTLESMGFTWSIENHFIDYQDDYHVIKLYNSPSIVLGIEDKLYGRITYNIKYNHNGRVKNYIYWDHEYTIDLFLINVQDKDKLLMAENVATYTRLRDAMKWLEKHIIDKFNEINKSYVELNRIFKDENK